MEDRDIVGMFLQREELAIYHTSEKYGGRLRALAQNIVQDAQTAEECENDTYVEAWNSIPPHQPVDYLYAFLARITRHISLNCCRDRSRLKRKAWICQLTSEMEECIPAPDDCACRVDDMAFAQGLNGFLSSLSAEKRRIFLRRYWYMDSIADISKHFHLSQSKVKTTLFRCRRKLREYLEQEGYWL